METVDSRKDELKQTLSSPLSYLLNPFTILSCVAKSTCGLNNAVISLFILATVKGQWAPAKALVL